MLPDFITQALVTPLAWLFRHGRGLSAEIKMVSMQRNDGTPLGSMLPLATKHLEIQQRPLIDLRKMFADLDGAINRVKRLLPSVLTLLMILIKLLTVFLHTNAQTVDVPKDIELTGFHHTTKLTMMATL